MKVMLLAAGEGTRFRPHTLQVPKPAIPLLNVPLAYYSLHLLKILGSLDITVNTYHLPEQITNCLNPIRGELARLNFSHETKLLGSGGGLWNVRQQFLNSSTLVLMNADEIILPASTEFLNSVYQTHKSKNALSTLIVMEHPQVGTKFGAVWLDAKNNVIGFGKNKPSNAASGLHFIGLQFLSDRIFNYLPDGESNILTDAVMRGIQAGELVQVHKISTEWYETGNLQDYLSASKSCLQLLNERKNSLLNSLIEKYAPDSQIIKNSKGIFFIDKSAQVNIDQLKDFAVIGKNVKVNPGLVIQNSVIAANVHVKSNIINNLVLTN